MVKFLENVGLKEGKLREFSNADYRKYPEAECFNDEDEDNPNLVYKPLIYSGDDFDIVVCAANPYDEMDLSAEVLLEDESDTHEYYKTFKTRKGAVRYAETIIGQIGKYDSVSDAALALDFNLR